MGRTDELYLTLYDFLLCVRSFGTAINEYMFTISGSYLHYICESEIKVNQGSSDRFYTLKYFGILSLTLVGYCKNAMYLFTLLVMSTRED